MVALLASMALAIDLGILFKTRGEAQRAADASALAGASAFLDHLTPADAVDDAEARAMQLAVANHMTGGPIRPEEVTIQVIPDSQKVRVWVNRASVVTWFANFFGVFSKPIGAVAAAEAVQAGTVQECVKPFLIPDIWGELTGEDLNNNKHWDLPDNIFGPGPPPRCGSRGLECWRYNDGDDVYAQFGDADVPAGEWTGYGSDWRNSAVTTDVVGTGTGNVQHKADYGRKIVMYPRNPHLAIPSGYYLWRIECPGAECVRDAIVSCVPYESVVDMELAVDQPGAVASLAPAIEEWINQDPDAYWEQTIGPDGFVTGQVVSPTLGLHGNDNPRVFVAAMMHPINLQEGLNTAPISNFGRFFLESGPTHPGQPDPLVARFMGPVSGLGPEDPNLGTLVKTLRLVE